MAAAMAAAAFRLLNEDATLKLGALVGRLLVPLCLQEGRALLVNLEGELGAGKTTLTRGLLWELGFHGAVRSPTYTLMEPYEFSGFTVFHFDLYRLREPEELEYLGVRDCFASPALCLAEWPEKAAGVLPAPDLIITISHQDPGRAVVLQSDKLSFVSLEKISLEFN